MKTFATNGLSTGGVAIILALAAGALSQHAVAADEEDSPPPALMDRKFTLAIGGFFPRVQSTVTLTSPRGFGKEVNGEDLGLDKSMNSAWIHSTGDSGRATSFKPSGFCWTAMALER